MDDLTNFRNGTTFLIKCIRSSLCEYRRNPKLEYCFTKHTANCSEEDIYNIDKTALFIFVNEKDDISGLMWYQAVKKH